MSETKKKPTKKAEVAVLPSEIQEVMVSSGMEMTRAEEIASRYAPFMIQAQEISSRLIGLKKEDPEAGAIAKRVRIDLGKVPTPVGELKKEDKEALMNRVKYIDALHNSVVGFVRENQAQAKEIEDYQENLIRIAQEKIQSERQTILEELGMEHVPTNLGQMEDSVYETLKAGVIASMDAKKKAEEERLAIEARLELYNARLKELAPLMKYVPEGVLTLESSEADFEFVKLNAVKKEKEEIAKQKEIEKENAELKKAEQARLKAEEERKAKNIAETAERMKSAIAALVKLGFSESANAMSHKLGVIIPISKYNGLYSDNDLQQLLKDTEAQLKTASDLEKQKKANMDAMVEIFKGRRGKLEQVGLVYKDKTFMLDESKIESGASVAKMTQVEFDEFLLDIEDMLTKKSKSLSKKEQLNSWLSGFTMTPPPIECEEVDAIAHTFMKWKNNSLDIIEKL